MRIAAQRDHRADRPVGLRQVDVHPLPEPDERPDPDRPRRGPGRLPRRRTSTTPRIDPVQVRKRIGMVFQKPNPFPKSIYDNIAFGPRVVGMKGDMDEIVESRPAPRGAVGRGQGPPEDERVRHVRRPAAAPVHRPRARHRARRAADGRAVLGAGPDLHRAHRGPDDGAQAELLDRHRHPQHAAGGARVGQDRVLHGRARRRRPSTGRATWSSTT